MIKEIARIGPKGVGVEHPSAIRNGYAELIFFIALAVQRQKNAIVGAAELNEGPEKVVSGGA